MRILRKQPPQVYKTRPFYYQVSSNFCPCPRVTNPEHKSQIFIYTLQPEISIDKLVMKQ